MVGKGLIKVHDIRTCLVPRHIIVRSACTPEYMRLTMCLATIITLLTFPKDQSSVVDNSGGLASSSGWLIYRETSVNVTLVC